MIPATDQSVGSEQLHEYYAVREKACDVRHLGSSIDRHRSAPMCDCIIVVIGYADDGTVVKCVAKGSRNIQTLAQATFDSHLNGGSVCLPWLGFPGSFSFDAIIVVKGIIRQGAV